MPSWEFVQEHVLPILLYLVLPALASAALVMGMMIWLGGARQASAGAALALCIGAVFGLWAHLAGPSLREGALSVQDALVALRNALDFGQSTWGRLPWAILAALVIGRLATAADVLASDGWLVRGGAAIAIAWGLIPEADRDEFMWMAPAFAAVIAALWIILDRLAAQLANGSIAVAVILALLTAAQIMIHAHSASLMEVLAALGFAFTGLAIIACWRGVQFGGAIPAIAVGLPAMLLMGQRRTISKLHWITFALPACAPLLLCLTLPLAHWPRWRLHLTRLVLVLAPLALAVVLAWSDDPLNFEDDWGE